MHSLPTAATAAIRMQAATPVRRRRSEGFSLIELMIALALGVVLLLGLITIFEGVRATFNAAEARARIQENGRFALSFLREDIRMAGQLGCLRENLHFPETTVVPPATQNRLLEPDLSALVGTGVDYGFYNHLIGPGATAIRDNVPYTTRMHRAVEVYEFAGTSPGSPTYTIASATPAVSGNAASWSPTLPNADLGNIANLAIPGSDILVLRYFRENPYAITAPVGANGVITLASAAEAATVQRWALYGLADCRNATLFQVTTAAAGSTVTAATGGLNVARAAGVWFRNQFGPPYTIGSMMSRYHFVVYYVGLGANGPALMRRTLIQQPTSAAQGTQLSAPEEVIEGVEMMQILVGVAQPTPGVIDGYVDNYFGPAAHLNPAVNNTATLLDARLREISSLRVSLLIRGNTDRVGAQRARNTIVVGDLNVTLPDDGRARQTYDVTMGIRNRLSS